MINKATTSTKAVLVSVHAFRKSVIVKLEIFKVDTIERPYIFARCTLMLHVYVTLAFVLMLGSYLKS